MEPSACCDVLVVEDNPADARLIQMALNDASPHIKVHRVSDGAEALDYLRHQGRFTEVPRPHFVLLDLNLPKINGHEVLEQVKRDVELSAIPVIVLSTSGAKRDVERCYNARANSYVVKRNTLDGMFEALNVCHQYWCGTVALAGV